MLLTYGLTHFHMAHFNGRSGEFVGWKEKKRTKCFEKALSIINSCTTRPFVDAVLMNDYHEINEAYTFEEVYGAPFAFVGWRIYAQLH